ncbi:hypothetical protein CBR_g20390 [Chara braunii]|uniref:Uncharacterized protein n=1 Tax=Chara braunii TaxID=69332 RepID=A0A388JUA8_CHABU|nr:hypothetical protein CBR_g20390 [Chara braunii]|eukprot:GBG61357.1 hypothetical protein CBR_g20390 [Chara braunii]
MARGLASVVGSTDETERIRDYVNYVKSDLFLRPYQPRGLGKYTAERPIRNLLSFRSTAVKMVLRSADFYTLMTLHLVLLATFRAKGRCRGPDGEVLRLGNGFPKTTWPRISNDMFLILAPLLVFVLVFYNNQAYNRFMEQFFIARQIEGRVKYLTSRLRAFFRRDPFRGADHSMRAILRTLVVAHYCLYFRLPRYSKQKIDEWGLEYLRKCGLITGKEREVLQEKTGPEIMGEALAFSTELLGQHVRRGDIDTVTYGLFEADIHRLSYFVMVITAYANNPVPFAYYHLASLLTLGHLVLISYSFVLYDSLFTIIVFALLCLTILGLRDLSCALADPFGVDDTDLPTILPTAKAHALSEALLDRDTIFGPAVIKEVPENESRPITVEEWEEEEERERYEVTRRQRVRAGSWQDQDFSRSGLPVVSLPSLRAESRPHLTVCRGLERDQNSEDVHLGRDQVRDRVRDTWPVRARSWQEQDSLHLDSGKSRRQQVGRLERNQSRCRDPVREQPRDTWGVRARSWHELDSLHLDGGKSRGVQLAAAGRTERSRSRDTHLDRDQPRLQARDMRRVHSLHHYMLQTPDTWRQTPLHVESAERKPPLTAGQSQSQSQNRNQTWEEAPPEQKRNNDQVPPREQAREGDRDDQWRDLLKHYRNPSSLPAPHVLSTSLSSVACPSALPPPLPSLSLSSVACPSGLPPPLPSLPSPFRPSRSLSLPPAGATTITID